MGQFFCNPYGEIGIGYVMVGSINMPRSKILKIKERKPFMHLYWFITVWSLALFG